MPRPRDDKNDNKPKRFEKREEHPRFRVDANIRKHGFRIHARRGADEPLWERKGIVYSQSEVLDWIREGMDEAECEGV